MWGMHAMPTLATAAAAMLFAPLALAQPVRASFELSVESSPVLPAGSTRISPQGATVTAVRGLAPGNSDGLEIRFEQDKQRYAAVVVFLDKERKPWQVNLSYVVPGATLVRTVAWKPEDLQPWISGLRFDGKRVVLKNSGRFGEAGQERFTLAWNIDLDLPVMQQVRR
jgi:hypothetical protein